MEFTQALFNKYCAGVPPGDDLYAMTTLKHRKPIEVIGAEEIAERQSHLVNLTRASVTGVAINAPGDIKSIAPNITHLDLSRCQIPSWDLVADIVGQLPQLILVDLTENSQLGPDGLMKVVKAAPQLRSLSVNECGTNWEAVREAAAVLTELEELHADNNNIESLEPGLNAPNLAFLNVSGNKLKNWTDVQPISSLPRLMKLILSENPLTNIQYLGGFETLKHLSVQSTQIDNWQSVDEIDKFPNVEECRIKLTPLMNRYSGTDARLMTVARIAKLKILHGSEVDKLERDNAERYYIRFIVTPGTVNEHPRFQELCKKHGAPVAQISGAMGGQAVAPDDMVEVVLCHNMATVTKRMPSTLEVSRLKILVQRQFRITKFSLSIRNGKSALPTAMEDEMKSIAYYGAQQASEIMVNEEGK